MSLALPRRLRYDPRRYHHAHSEKERLVSVTNDPISSRFGWRKNNGLSSAKSSSARPLVATFSSDSLDAIIGRLKNLGKEPSHCEGGGEDCKPKNASRNNHRDPIGSNDISVNRPEQPLSRKEHVSRNSSSADIVERYDSPKSRSSQDKWKASSNMQTAIRKTSMFVEDHDCIEEPHQNRKAITRESKEMPTSNADNESILQTPFTSCALRVPPVTNEVMPTESSKVLAPIERNLLKTGRASERDGVVTGKLSREVWEKIMQIRAPNVALEKLKTKRKRKQITGELSTLSKNSVKSVEGRSL